MQVITQGNADGEADVRQFICKKLAQIGPVPDQEAVIRFMSKENNEGDSKLWQPLVVAAKQGNWMARFQIYRVLSQRSDLSYAQSYRSLQLVEWLEERKVGALYHLFFEDLVSSGYYSEDPSDGGNDTLGYAAMHGGYSAPNISLVKSCNVAGMQHYKQPLARCGAVL